MAVHQPWLLLWVDHAVELANSMNEIYRRWMPYFNGRKTSKCLFLDVGNGEDIVTKNYCHAPDEIIPVSEVKRRGYNLQFIAKLGKTQQWWCNKCKHIQATDGRGITSPAAFTNELEVQDFCNRSTDFYFEFRSLELTARGRHI